MSSASIRDHPWNGWTVTSSEVSVLWTGKSSIPATSAAVSCVPDRSLMLSGTLTEGHLRNPHDQADHTCVLFLPKSR